MQILRNTFRAQSDITPMIPVYMNACLARLVFIVRILLRHLYRVLLVNTAREYAQIVLIVRPDIGKLMFLFTLRLEMLQSFWC